MKLNLIILLLFLLVVTLFNSYIKTKNTNENYQNMIDNARSTYNKHKRNLRLSYNNTTENLRSQINRTLRLSGF